MILANPLWLWLVPLGLALAFLEARRHPRPWSTGVLRAALFGAIAMALARPLWHWQDRPFTTVAVVDVGPEVGLDELTRVSKLLRSGSTGVSRLVVFSSRAEAVAGPAASESGEGLDALRRRLGRPLWDDDPAGGASNLADALRLAGAQVPADGRGRVRLFATGLNQHGDAAAEAWRLAQRGIGVEVEPVRVAAPTKVVLRRIAVPAAVRVGETVRAVVSVECAGAGRVAVGLTAGDAAPVVVSADVVAGRNDVTLDMPFNKPGLAPVRAAAWVAGDGPPAGDVRAAVYVEAAAKALLVYDATDAGPDANGLAGALAALFGGRVAVESLPAQALAGRRLNDVDVVIVADVPADRLTPDAQQALRRAVSEGTGLLFTGAARSFGPGGYDDSALAALLPVAMPQSVESVDPSAALVLIIDTSSSMQGEPMNLAKEVARLAVTHLKPHDKVGIVEFYGGRRWAAALQPAGNLAVIHRALNRLTAMGSTVLYPAVEEAAFALRNVQTRSKHVLICSDGMVEEAPFAALARQMAKDGITVSTVQVAPPQKGPNLMANMARWTNGRHYVSPDQYGLPDISLKQPRTSVVSPLVREPSAVRGGEDAIVRDAAADAFGSIGGYVRTEAKPTADILLKTENGDPLLVRWRYGAGFVAALPTQLGSAMSADLQNRPAFARLLAGLFRQVGSVRGPALRLSANVRPAGVEVDVTAANPLAAPDGTLLVTLADATGRTRRTMNAEAIALGHWNLLMPNVPAGTYTLTASLPGTPADGHGGVAVTIPSSAPTADRALLDEIASFTPLAARNARDRSGHSLRFFDARPLFAALAAVILLMHVAARRWPTRSPAPQPNP